MTLWPHQLWIIHRKHSQCVKLIMTHQHSHVCCLEKENLQHQLHRIGAHSFLSRLAEASGEFSPLTKQTEVTDFCRLFGIKVIRVKIGTPLGWDPSFVPSGDPSWELRLSWQTEEGSKPSGHRQNDPSLPWQPTTTTELQNNPTRILTEQRGNKISLNSVRAELEL